MKDPPCFGNLRPGMKDVTLLVAGGGGAGAAPAGGVPAGAVPGGYPEPGSADILTPRCAALLVASQPLRWGEWAGATAPPPRSTAPRRRAVDPSTAIQRAAAHAMRSGTIVNAAIAASSFLSSLSHPSKVVAPSLNGYKLNWPTSDACVAAVERRAWTVPSRP
uniref:Uncharacterized protein n=1 Tax=Mantoniella antarctica TaxID=81844 RepID=A0A7S0X350_9CHLO